MRLGLPSLRRLVDESAMAAPVGQGGRLLPARPQCCQFDGIFFCETREGTQGNQTPQALSYGHLLVQIMIIDYKNSVLFATQQA